MADLGELFDGLPDGERRRALTHASWVADRADAYERLAFLGDSVLGLAVTAHLFPRLDPEIYGAGRLTKIRAQTVSGRTCRRVAERLGVPEQMLAFAPEQTPANLALASTERVLASIMEAIIGAVYLRHGYEVTAAAVVATFGPEIERALSEPADFKSALQERLARTGETVVYSVLGETGPPHERTFEVAALVGAEEVGRGAGRSKKDAEQTAASAALATLSGSMRPTEEPTA